MRDTLPKKPWKSESAVLNLNLSGEPGSHWTCYIKRDNIVQYYDSFAVPPPTEIYTYIGKSATILYNASPEQKINEVICGHLCLQFLYRSHVSRKA